MVLTRRSFLQQGLIVSAVAVALVAQLYVHQNPDSLAGWVLFISAAVLASLAGWGLPSTPDAIGIPSGQVTSRVRRLWWGTVAACAVAASTVLSAGN
jgi:hypothetical protein